MLGRVSLYLFFFPSRRRHTRFKCDWSSDVCSSDLGDDRQRQSHGAAASELRASARLALPVIAVQLGVMLMSTVDTAMLGHLSAEALASAAIAHVVSITLLMFGPGTLSALDPLVSQAFGAGDRRAPGGHLQRGLVLAVALRLPRSLL